MTEAPKLPPLPAYDYSDDAARVYTAAQMLTAMAQAAREQRERDAVLCDLEVRRLSAIEEHRAALAIGIAAAAIRSQPEPKP